MILDNFSRRGTEFNIQLLKEKYPYVKIVRGDVRFDKELLSNLVEENDVVLHLAAQVAVTTSIINPREDLEINALGTFNILEAVRNSKRRPLVIYSSTNKVYGELENFSVKEENKRYAFEGGINGIDEMTNLDFHSPYGCSKGIADQYVRDYARIYGLKTVVFRQSCIYGPHQFGIEDQGWVAWFVIAGLLDKKNIIYGNGKQVRDVLYVTDLICAYELAIEKIDKATGQIFNVGGGLKNSMSLLEFMDILREKYQIVLQPSFTEWRQGDQPIFISNNKKASDILGWKPAVDLPSGIGNLIQWLQEHRQEVKNFYENSNVS